MWNIRYIRDWLDWSNINNWNHWVEIQAFSWATNVALWKTVTSPYWITWIAWYSLTNWATSSSVYAFNTAFPAWWIWYMQVDLWSIQAIDTIKVWHYYADSRVYNRTKTEVSSDWINWFPIFDSTVNWLYTETAAWHNMTVPVIATPWTVTIWSARALVLAWWGWAWMNMWGWGWGWGYIATTSATIKEWANFINVWDWGKWAPAWSTWWQAANQPFNTKATCWRNTYAFWLTAVWGWSWWTWDWSNVFTTPSSWWAWWSWGWASWYFTLWTYTWWAWTSWQWFVWWAWWLAYYGWGWGWAWWAWTHWSAWVPPVGWPWLLNDILWTGYYWWGWGWASWYSAWWWNGWIWWWGWWAIWITTWWAWLNNWQAWTNWPFNAWANVPWWNAWANTWWGWGWGSHYNANNKWWDWGSWIVVISFPIDWSSWITTASTWWTITQVWWMQIHTFTTSWIFIARWIPKVPELITPKNVSWEFNSLQDIDLTQYDVWLYKSTSFILWWTPLSNWASFNSTTWLLSLSWVTAPKTFNLTLTWNNSTWNSNTVSFTIDALQVPPPVISTIPDTVWQYDSLTNIDISSYTTSHLPVLSYQLIWDYTTYWITFDSATGIINTSWFNIIWTITLTANSTNATWVWNTVSIVITWNPLAVPAATAHVLLIWWWWWWWPWGYYWWWWGWWAWWFYENLSINVSQQTYPITIWAWWTSSVYWWNTSFWTSVHWYWWWYWWTWQNSNFQWVTAWVWWWSWWWWGWWSPQQVWWWVTYWSWNVWNVWWNWWPNNPRQWWWWGWAWWVWWYASSLVAWWHWWAWWAWKASTISWTSVIYSIWWTWWAPSWVYPYWTSWPTWASYWWGWWWSQSWVPWLTWRSWIFIMSYPTDWSTWIKNWWFTWWWTISYSWWNTILTATANDNLVLTTLAYTKTVSSIPTQTLTNNISYTKDLNTYLTWDKPLLYHTLTWTLPIWLTFDTSTWILTWSSTQVWTYPVTYKATTAYWDSNVVSFNIVINSPTAPVMWAVSNIVINQWENINKTFSWSVTQTNLDPILSYTLTWTLIPWLSFNSTTWVLSWNPTQVWTYNYWIQATDKDWISNTSSFTLTINTVPLNKVEPWHMLLLAETF